MIQIAHDRTPIKCFIYTYDHGIIFERYAQHHFTTGSGNKFITVIEGWKIEVLGSYWVIFLVFITNRLRNGRMMAGQLWI